MSDSQWMTLADAAGRMGVSAEWLRQWTKRSDDLRLEYKKEFGPTGKPRRLVHLPTARAHIEKHCGNRLPARYVRETEIAEVVEAPAAQAVAATTPADFDPIAVGRGALMSGDTRTVLAATTLAGELRRRETDRAKVERNVTPEDVRAALRGIGRVWVDQTDAGLPRAAAAVLETARKTLGVNLQDARPDAAAVIEDALRRWAETVIVAVQREVDEQCQGIQRLC